MVDHPRVQDRPEPQDTRLLGGEMLSLYCSRKPRSAVINRIGKSGLGSSSAGWISTRAPSL
jgi:hypothetical protein